MGYNPLQTIQATNAMVAAMPGLQPSVARAWVSAEQGDNFNIVGVTYNNATGQHLYQYSSFTQGAQAAANLLKSNPAYAGIRQAIASGDAKQQAAAIIASPWNHPYYSKGGGAAGLRAIAGNAVSLDPIQGSVALSTGAATGAFTAAGPDATATTNLTPWDVFINFVTKGQNPIANVINQSIQDVAFDGAAILLGFVFVIVGLIMFLKGTDSPVQAVRETANDAVGLAAAAYAPEIAGARASIMSKAPRPVPKEPVSFAQATGMRDSAPASYSPETPRVEPRSVGYYANRRKRGKASIEFRDFFGNEESESA